MYLRTNCRHAALPLLHCRGSASSASSSTATAAHCLLFEPATGSVTGVATHMPGVTGVAILGKENNPLYIRAFGAHNQLRFHFIVHTALDFVEEKGAPHPPATRRSRLIPE